MSEIVIGVGIAVSLLAIMITGMPISLALGMVGIAIIYMLGSLQFDLVGELVFQSLSGFELLTIPLFIIMSSFFANSNAGRDLYEAAARWLNRVPGNLAIANIIGCAIFAALSGSSPATAAAIGGIGIPEMRKRGFPGSFAAAVIVAGGTLGILIPPSITMILYGIAVQESIGKLFLAGVVPGIMLTVLFSLWCVIYWFCWGKKSSEAVYYASTNAIPNYSWAQKFSALGRSWPSMLLILLIIWSLYRGIATPSEIAAIGAVFALAIVVFWYRSLNIKSLIKILTFSANESSMILLIVAMALLFSYPLSFMHIPQSLIQAIAGIGISRWWLLLVINIILLIFGMFLPPAAVIMMVTPVIDPLLRTLGFDPIWFGVILTLNMEIGLITPPVGFNLYVVQSIASDVPMSQIVKQALPFIFIMILAMVILSFFPQIALWLPNKIISTGTV